ncbi:MAG: DMT family transporter [Desulfobacterales bacterium]|nr:DMT family transporter [Desulfobacterales bacterium]
MCDKRRVVGIAALVMVTLFWGMTFTVIKGALDDAAVSLFLGQRFLLAFGMLLLAKPFAKNALNVYTLGRGIFLGLSVVAGYGLQTVALLFTTASKTAFLTGLNVVWVPVIAALFFKKRLEKAKCVGMALAVLGIYLLCGLAGASDFSTVSKGDFYALASAVFFALHILYTGRYAGRCDSYWLAVIQLGTIGAIFGGISLFKGYPLFTWNPEVAWALLLCSFLATVLPFLIQTIVQKWVSPTDTALTFCLEPVFAACFAWALAGEAMGATEFGGAALILTGMIVSEVWPNKKRV